jgi:hypothetical protein
LAVSYGEITISLHEETLARVKERLNSVELNLTTVAMAQNFFKTNRASVDEQCLALKIEGCSKPKTE